MKYLKIFELKDEQEAQGEDMTSEKVYLAFGEDLTQKAANGELEPVIGRTKELEQLIWILSRKQKNNPVLIGEPGVGKTAAVELLAQKIASGDCPEIMLDKKVISIDLVAVSAQGLLNRLLKEVETDNLILFMDEVHTIMPIKDTLKPALARGSVSLIGATTLSEFRGSIEKDQAMERRMQKIFVDEPSFDECLEILKGIKSKYEDFHKVTYTEESIVACIKLAQRYITDRFLPDKAIDLLDEVGARVRMQRTKNPKIKELELQVLDLMGKMRQANNSQQFELKAQIADQLDAVKKELTAAKTGETRVEITKKMVEDVIQLKTRIPVSMAQGQKEVVKGIASRLKLAVIGQDEAVDTVSRVVMRNKAGLGSKNRPQGVFLFLGPTGVGKTHLVKSLAKELMGSEDKIIRLDMSEFAQDHTVSRLYGSPPGYVGYGEGGQLTEPVRRNPYSIVLLDEIEKAHPKVFDAFLQVFDDGHMTDGEGRKVNFKNTIIIMTSNIGTKAVSQMRPTVGYGTRAADQDKQEVTKQTVIGELKTFMRPEFINRIDEIVIFRSLDRENLYKIVDGELKVVASKLADKNMTLNWTDNVKELILQYGYEPSMGARPLKRSIQQHIENPITDAILDDKVSDNIELDAVQVDGGWKLVINGEQINERKNYITRLFTFFKG